MMKIQHWNSAWINNASDNSMRVITHRCASHHSSLRVLSALVTLTGAQTTLMTCNAKSKLVRLIFISPLYSSRANPNNSPTSISKENKAAETGLLSQSHFTLKKSIFLRRTRINNGFLKWKMKLERDEAEVGEEEVLLGRMYYSKHYWCSDDTHYYYEITGTVKGSAIKILAITQFCLFVPSLLCIFISLG